MPERCDHICLLDADHVDRGEPHFYGYEHPSPRTGRVRLALRLQAARHEARCRECRVTWRSWWRRLIGDPTGMTP